jgi:aminotransferase EvaB
MLNSRIPINDLSRGANHENKALLGIINEVVKSGWYINGPYLQKFEGSLSDYLNSAFTYGVGNGTDALTLALSALKVGQDDLVAVAANAGGYSTTAVKSLGAKQIYFDVEIDTALASPHSIQKLLENFPETKCIIVTHLYGNAVDMDSILSVTKNLGIPVIEDCAQAIGATHNGRKVGTWGDIGTFSFFPTKNLGGIGDGGAVTTSRQDIAERLKSLRQYGWGSKYCVENLGGQNTRLDEIQAAILSYRLESIDEKNQLRRDILQCYANEVKDSDDLNVLWNSANNSGVGHLAVVATPHRSKLASQLAAAGIESDIHYPIPDYRQPAWKNPDWVEILTNTEFLSEQILTLPCFPEMTKDEVSIVCKALREFDSNVIS